MAEHLNHVEEVDGAKEELCRSENGDWNVLSRPPVLVLLLSDEKVAEDTEVVLIEAADANREEGDECKSDADD